MSVLSAVLPVFAIIAAGYGFGRWRRVGEDGVALLNNYVVWLALPALLFDFMAEADWALLGQGRFILVFSVGMGVTLALSMLWSRRDPLGERAIQGLAAAYANTAYLGIPLLQGLLGAVGVAAAVLGSMLTVSLLFALCVALVEFDLHRGAGIGRTIGKAALGVARNPLVFAPVLGLVWNAAGLGMPAPARTFLTLLGGSTTPVALATIGVFLAIPRPKAPAGPVAVTTILKLLVQPLATAAMLLLLPLPREWAAAALLLAAMPTGTGPFMAAQLYERDVALTARVILISTLVSVGTLSVLAMVLLG
ncbi:AEC family transporter [Stakelama tenebrarum]|uniref:AEC family transporter n=1 Tax=Stakelama tenebrarum TaxID=2711215 RepID=A0A6G6Y7S2_9SPHN|nr:AEC family transporter [Sphingosinithalassobacter tenebrarum]QIG80975.1 AEC family transporter [Sphingosinithalassobacter tenebrarum]